MRLRLSKYTVLGIIVLGVTVSGFFFYVHQYMKVFTRPLYQMSLCEQQVEKLYSVLNEFIRDNGGTVPEAFDWCDTIVSCDASMKEELSCPNSKSQDATYCLNKYLLGRSLKGLAQDIVFLFESGPGWNRSGGKEDACADRHCIGRSNWVIVIYLNGEVERVPDSIVDNLNWGGTTGE